MTEKQDSVPEIGIINYDIGNLRSVEQAFLKIGADFGFVRTAEEIRQCKKLVLPGVGAFSGCTDELKKRDLWTAIEEKVADGTPLFGICVGMQMLFETSEEFGVHEGFGFIKGAVKAIPHEDCDGQPHKIPHIAWSPLLNTAGLDWSKTVLAGIEEETEMYFVHSFTGHPACEEERLADTQYGGHPISAIVQKGAVIGTQFHPEKSGAAGLQILKNFLAM